MNKIWKIAVVLGLAAAVGLVIVLKQGGDPPATAGTEELQSEADVAIAKQDAGIPRLVDLGAGKCIPCIMMAPILEDLKKEYAGRLCVEFIDVRENPDVGRWYGIRVIPTQIFYDASGKEIYRHEGFMSKEDILARWEELGIDLAGNGRK